MVTPTAVPNQNLGLAAINRTFKQLREHPATTFGAAALLCIPLAFVGVIGALRPGIGSGLLQLLVGGIIGIWVAYAITVAVAEFSEGRDPGPGGLLRQSLSAGLLRFGFTSLLVNLVLGLIAIVALIPFFLSLASVDVNQLLRFKLSEGDIFRMLMGFLLSLPILLAALLFAYLRLGLATAASALDGTGPGASLGRSWQVTKGHMWEFFVLTFLAALITAAVSIFVSGPAAMVSIRPPAPAGSDSLTPEFFQEQLLGSELGPVEAVVTAISGYLSAVLLTPFSAALLANFFMLVRKPTQGLETRYSMMVPLKPPGGEAPSVPIAPPAVVAPADAAAIPPAEPDTTAEPGVEPGPPGDRTEKPPIPPPSA